MVQSTWLATLEVQDLRDKGHHVMLRVTFHPQDHKKKKRGKKKKFVTMNNGNLTESRTSSRHLASLRDSF